jgi:hypothetical protein
MRWSIPALIAFLGLSTLFAQEGLDKAAPVHASLKLENLTIEVFPTDRPGEIQLTVNKDGGTFKFEVAKLSGKITKLSACSWNSNRGVAIAIEAKSGDTPRWSYHWMTIDIKKDGRKIELKRIGAPSEAFLSDLPNEHTLNITNPRSDTIHILLTGKEPTPSAIGYLYVHDCPVGLLSSKKSGYAKLHELRAVEVEKGK